MKLTLLAIALALPCIAQASYSMKIPLEAAQGGSLENNSIVFNKPATTPTNPVEPVEPEQPTEPEIVDPFAPENPDCDPLAQGYPGNSTGKDEVWIGSYRTSEGLDYRACKLKEQPEDKLLARFAAGFSLTSDTCNFENPNNILYTNRCYIALPNFSFFYNISKIEDSYTFSNYQVEMFMPSTADFTFDQVGRIEIDGVDCENPRVYVHPVFKTKSNLCNYPLTHEQMMQKYEKPFIVKIYSK